ncbi:anoctamin-9 [Salvelinus namaycush]|uniref:Anoctamin n=1 Tax=Salvelinus namaycush TaxID=8040 RepID=A0A8U1C336_SALNM|nr:anoctamin-9 [Salvelinus namaycush]
MYFKNPEQDGIELQERNTDGFDNTMEALLPTLHQQRTYDYVLVADKVEDQEHPKFLKQIAFIDHLRKKNMKVTKIVHDDKVFYGVRALKEIFDKYRYLLKVSDACNWSGDRKCVIIPHSTRIRVVDYILHHTHINTGENLRELQKKGVFEATFCLHERNKQKVLKQKWARWSALCTTQPVDDVRSYFGEKVALYYLWLGLYTILLVPAAILGVIVFLYALAFFNTSPLIKEVCESDTVMCPRCDKWCQVWQLRDTCTYAKVSHLFDNEGTVFFAMFMAVWATIFLELWKRHKAMFVSKWKVFDWCEEEEELILGVVNDPHCHPKEFRHSYLRSTLVLVLVTLMLVLIIGLTQALVVFRVVAAVQLSEGTLAFVRDNANTVAVMLGAVLHYITMQVMTRVNKAVAFKLCEIEKTQSFAATERSFTVKMFTFQFFTLFSSLIYVAFFLGRINGRPGSYVRISGKWRLEECHPSGCLTDLFIQMAVIMLLKQTLNNIFEFTVPWFKSYFRRTTTKKLERKCGHCYKNACREVEMGHDPCDICKLRDWLRNYDLNDVNSFSLFNEFLEMVLQFSFTTIFVAAFPLAPLLALINNIFEIRLDAIKMVSLERRLVSKKTNDIGIWTKVLEAIGVLAVIANGLVIGVSSDFIPRLVYRYHYGPCANGEADVHCMKGYINDTLSTAHITDLSVRNDFFPSQLITESGFNVTQCSYKDYRNDVDYSLTSQYWLIMALRFAFVVLFEHVVVIFKFIAAWFVPDSPMLVKNDRLKDKLSRLKEELQYMKYSQSTDV